eukprot:7335-Heterococcus_DN1.PRE.1
MVDAAAGVAQLVIRIGQGARNAQSYKKQSMRLAGRVTLLGNKLMQKASSAGEVQVVESLLSRIDAFLKQVEAGRPWYKRLFKSTAAIYRHFNEEINVVMSDLDFADGRCPVEAPVAVPVRAPVRALLLVHVIGIAVASAAVVMLYSYSEPHFADTLKARPELYASHYSIKLCLCDAYNSRHEACSQAPASAEGLA